jgi:hypothetical protein
MPPTPAWFAQCRAIIAENFGEQLEAVSITLRVIDGRSLTYRLPPEPAAGPRDGIEQAVLQVLRSGPQIGKALAHKAGYSYSSHFRGVLAEMYRKGRIQRCPEGYCLPGQR